MDGISHPKHNPSQGEKEREDREGQKGCTDGQGSLMGGQEESMGNQEKKAYGKAQSRNETCTKEV